jgi:hypothetical protein
MGALVIRRSALLPLLGDAAERSFAPLALVRCLLRASKRVVVADGFGQVKFQPAAGTMALAQRHMVASAASEPRL